MTQRALSLLVYRIKHLQLKPLDVFCRVKRENLTFSSRSLSSDGKNSMERLKNFLQNEKEMVQTLNKELALPYINIGDLAGNLSDKLKQRTSQSALLASAYHGQMHHPAIPMKYILSNIQGVELNLKNRKMADKEIDLQQDIIQPFKRIQKLEKEKKKYEDKKAQLTDGMEEFWIKHSANKSEIIPHDIEEQRREAIHLSCVISLLSWIEDAVKKLFYENAILLPNMTHPATPVGDEAAGVILKTVGEKPLLELLPVDHMDVGDITSTIRQSNMTNFAGQRTYYLFKEAAELEQALVGYTLDRLREKGFHVISCPNILHGSAFEGCGVASTKKSDMLYRIDSAQEKEFYITGTSEVGIAAFLANHAISFKHLPLKLCCVSTCNRKETNSRMDPKGLYRVHHFTKVEMFGVTASETGQESEEIFQEFLHIQEELFTDLGLHFRIVNMPTGELGLPAYQKVDMEAWMSARGSYGEISSTSNCTDFQSRRLHILYKNRDGEYKFAHTLNGTACAVPRLLIALVENNQTKDRTTELPRVLQPYMKRTTIDRTSRMPMEYVGPNQSKNKQRTPKE